MRLRSTGVVIQRMKRSSPYAEDMAAGGSAERAALVALLRTRPGGMRRAS